MMDQYKAVTKTHLDETWEIAEFDIRRFVWEWQAANRATDAKVWFLNHWVRFITEHLDRDEQRRIHKNNTRAWNKNYAFTVKVWTNLNVQRVSWQLWLQRIKTGKLDISCFYTPNGHVVHFLWWLSLIERKNQPEYDMKLQTYFLLMFLLTMYGSVHMAS